MDKKEERLYTAEEFAKEYEELCKKTSWQVVASPVWTLRDDGTFSLVLKYSVAKAVEEKK